MSMSTYYGSPEHLLRPVQTALNVLGEYGGDTPEPLREAFDRYREVRVLAVEARAAETITYAREVVGADDMRKALVTAAKRRAADRDRAEIAEKLADAAAENVVATFRKHSDDIAAAILSSDRLTQAFNDVTRYAADVPASAPAEPAHNDVDLTARVALLRRAAQSFERAYSALVATDLLMDEGIPGAPALLFADPTGASPSEVRRALKGLRPGTPEGYVWTSSATSAPHTAPFAAPGVPAAILNQTPGVVLSPARDAATFYRRTQHLL